MGTTMPPVLVVQGDCLAGRLNSTAQQMQEWVKLEYKLELIIPLGELQSTLD